MLSVRAGLIHKLMFYSGQGDKDVEFVIYSSRQKWVIKKLFTLELCLLVLGKELDVYFSIFFVSFLFPISIFLCF